jgi:REP-associated tyrosine transposase
MAASSVSRRRRHSVRLPAFDYGQDGAYFITICTHRRANLFGTIDHGRVALTAAGQIAWDEWLRSPTIRPELTLGAFVVMPDHVHGIVIVNHAGIVGAHGRAPLPDPPRHPNHEACPNIAGAHGRASLPDPAHRGIARINGMPTSPTRTVGTFVRGYKCAVTVATNIARRSPGISVWQRNYFEHVIRTEHSFHAITQYIKDNPRRAWKFS